MEKTFLFSKNSKGFGMIEALIGITVAGLFLMVFSTLIIEAIKVNRVNSSRIKATMYLQELIEIAKDLEQDPNWAELEKPCTQISPCYPLVSSTEWILTSENSGKENLEDNYTRWLVIEDVCRNFEGEMAACQPGEKPNTKKVTATITWNNGTSTLETYVYRY